MALPGVPGTAIQEQDDEAGESEQQVSLNKTGAKRASCVEKMSDPVGAEAVAEIADGVDQRDGARRGGRR